MEKTLDQIGLEYDTDKSSRCHQYLDFYDEAFKELRHKEIKILEIGILHGKSIRMLREYFTKAEIHAVDIVEGYVDAINNANLPNLTANILNQGDRNMLGIYFDKHGPFDIIIDDGSHIISHQKLTFDVSMEKGLSENGIYVLEDLHTSLREQYGSSSSINDESITTLEMLRSLQKENAFDITIQEKDTKGYPGDKSITSIIKRN